MKLTSRSRDRACWDPAGRRTTDVRPNHCRRPSLTSHPFRCSRRAEIIEQSCRRRRPHSVSQKQAGPRSLGMGKVPSIDISHQRILLHWDCRRRARILPPESRAQSGTDILFFVLFMIKNCQSSALSEVAIHRECSDALCTHVR